MTNRLDVFLQVDHVGVDALTRTLHPLFGKSADLNFVESTKFLERISRTSAENGPGMQRLARRLDQGGGGHARPVCELTTQVYRDAQQRLAAAERRDELSGTDRHLSVPARHATTLGQTSLSEPPRLRDEVTPR